MIGYGSGTRNSEGGFGVVEGNEDSLLERRMKCLFF